MFSFDILSILFVCENEQVAALRMTFRVLSSCFIFIVYFYVLSIFASIFSVGAHLCVHLVDVRHLKNNENEE